MNQNSFSNRLVVYTVLLGQMAELNKTPECSGVDFVCLTDQENVTSNGWVIRTITSMWPEDAPKSSRHPKINAHLYFRDYSRSIYVDSSVQLTGDPELLWSKLVHSDEIVFGGAAHSFHLNMLEEINAVSQLGYEVNSVVMAQANFSLGIFPGYLSARPVWGGILARRHNQADCVSAMELWFSLVTDHSRRDQLSLPLALRVLKGNQYQVSYLDNRKSEFHCWPVAGYTKGPDYKRHNTGVLELEVLGAQGLDPLSINALNAKSERDAITAERDAITAERDAITAERDAITAERDAITAERDAMLRTKTWRWTKCIRQLVFGFSLRARALSGSEKRAYYKSM